MKYRITFEIIDGHKITDMKVISLESEEDYQDVLALAQLMEGT